MISFVSARQRLATAVLVLTLAFQFTGCGEKEEPDPPTAASAIAQGDEICSEAQAEIDALRDQAPEGPEDAARLTEGVLATYEQELAELDALPVPADLEDELDRYLSARERALVPLREGLEAARAGNAAAYARAQAAAAAGQVERTRLARQVGFRECSLPAGGAPPG
jgi:hypothetical protein